MAIKYKTVTRDSWMSEDELKEESKGGWELVSHAAWAYSSDQNNSPKETEGPEHNYIFAYAGGTRGGRSIHGRGY